MDFEFTEEQLAIKEAAKDFAENEITVYAFRYVYVHYEKSRSVFQ